MIFISFSKLNKMQRRFDFILKKFSDKWIFLYNTMIFLNQKACLNDTYYLEHVTFAIWKIQLGRFNEDDNDFCIIFQIE